MGKVLDSVKQVCDKSKHVSINQNGIDRTCQIFKNADTKHWLDPAPFKISALNDQDRLNFIITLNSLSFSYWGEPKWTIEYEGKKYDGTWALIVALKKALDKGIPILDSKYRQKLTRQDLEYILKGNTEIPLLDKRLEITQEVAKIINEKYKGDFANLLNESSFDALKIVEQLTNQFKAFNDTRVYNGQLIYFCKKAQLLVWDIYNMFKKHKFGDIKNIDKLTALADYKIPQMLRRFSVLEYSPNIAKKIDNSVKIAENSEEEVEIRSNTVWAIERIKQKLHKNILSLEINDYFWLLSQDKNFSNKPYHRTRTCSY